MDKLRTILSRDKKPCGCTVTEYDDGAKQMAPCVPCGLFMVSQFLRQASEALGAVATTIRAQNEGPHQ